MRKTIISILVLLTAAVTEAKAQKTVDVTKVDATHYHFDMPAYTVLITMKLCPEASMTSVPVASVSDYTVGMPLVEGGSIEGGFFEYALGTDDETVPSTGWTATVPVAATPGTFYVWYRGVGDSGHCDCEINNPQCVTVNFTVPLANNGDNTELISAIATNQCGGRADVKLTDRTLYKDGGWNTLCLPFDVTVSGSVLDGDNVQAMTLNTTTSGLSDDGTLTLNFTEAVMTIPAGTPFIIKWDAEGEDITAPVFEGVTIDDTKRNATVAGVLTFTGTYFPMVIGSEGDNTVLYLGAANTLYYPTKAMTIGSQRAYFQLADGLTAGEPTSSGSRAHVRAIALNFGDEATGIKSLSAGSKDAKDSEAWHTLDGRRLSDKPTKSGLYINNGKKVVVK